jgi:CubicO group peptidase (beta-lactamase class C family)
MKFSGPAKLILLVVLGVGCRSSRLSPDDQSRFPSPTQAEAIDRLFSAMDNDVSPGCALTLLDGNEVALTRGYGMANLEYGIPIDPTTVFRTGSVSKQFTAATVALLAEEGALSLDDPLSRFLPEIPNQRTEITLQHLLNHTSGIRDYLDLMALAGRGSDDFYRKEQALALLTRQQGLNFHPGTRFLYSNSGYFLLSQVVERATGETLRQAAQARIFGPLGMKDTHFHDDRSELVARRADGYAPREGGGFEIAMTKLDLVGDGGLFTSAEEIAVWLGSFETREIGSGDFLPTLLTRGRLVDGTTLSYALGIGHGTRRGLDYVGHGGSFVGFKAATLWFPEQHMSVGLLCNRSDIDPMGRALAVAEVILEEEMTPVPPPEGGGAEARADAPEDDPPTESGQRPLPQDLLGSYFSPELDATYRILSEGGGLVADIDGIRTLPLTRRGEDHYRALFIDMLFRRENGRVTGLDAALPRAEAIRFLRRDSSE